MKKTLLAFVFAASFAAPASAQGCGDYEQFHTGVVYTMTSYNGKDKVTGTVTTTVDKATQTASGATADLTQVVKNEKGKEESTMKSTVTCSGGKFSIDMKNFMPAESDKMFKDMTMTFEGNTLDYPSSMKAGETLPDGKMKVTGTSTSSSGVGYTMILNITDRKVLATESVTTTAGTFECYKISYTMDSNMKMTMPNGGEMNMPGLKPRQITEWFSYKVGAVKSETWNGDKKEGYTVLTELKKN